MEFLGIDWASFDKIWLLPIFILFIFLIFKNYYRIKTTISFLINPKNRKLLLKNYSNLRQNLKLILMILSIIFLLIAILQPRWGIKEEIIKQEGRDLLFLLDVSRSMCAKDLKPSRLEFVKLKIQTLLKKVKSDRVGLILFSDNAFVYCPLTIDHSAFLTLLSNVECETLFSGGTSLQAALNKAFEHFDHTKSKNKMIILFTDGEDFSENLENVKKIAMDKKIILCALGVGSLEGAPIPIFDYEGKQIGYEKDKEGKVVLSTLNEDLLKKLTKELSGKYMRISFDDSDIDKIMNFVSKFDKEKFEEVKANNLIERYPIFLLFSFIFLALEWIL